MDLQSQNLKIPKETGLRFMKPSKMINNSLHNIFNFNRHIFRIFRYHFGKDHVVSSNGRRTLFHQNESEYC